MYLVVLTFIKAFIKLLLQDINPLWVHDCIHAHVSTLTPIPMGTYLVTGVNGLAIPEFWGTHHHTPTYPGELDEARIGIHQFLSSPMGSPCYLARYVYWCGYLLQHGINPIVVTYYHWRSM